MRLIQGWSDRIKMIQYILFYLDKLMQFLSVYGTVLMPHVFNLIVLQLIQDHDSSSRYEKPRSLMFI